MTSQTNSIEFTQDGMAVLYDKSTALCAYTEEIETCCVYLIIFESTTIAIHDTGQLCIDEIINYTGKFGEAKKIRFAINPKELLKKQTASHTTRRSLLAKRLNFRKNIMRIDAPNGAIVFTRDGNSIISKSGIIEHKLELLEMPSKEKRLAINTLNNLFSKRNSQALKIDIQYENGIYTELPILTNTESEIEKFAIDKSTCGDSDYLKHLNYSRSIGVFT